MDIYIYIYRERERGRDRERDRFYDEMWMIKKHLELVTDNTMTSVSLLEDLDFGFLVFGTRRWSKNYTTTQNSKDYHWYDI
jgi:hypothetical protein